MSRTTEEIEAELRRFTEETPEDRRMFATGATTLDEFYAQMARRIEAHEPDLIAHQEAGPLDIVMPSEPFWNEYDAQFSALADEEAGRTQVTRESGR